MEEGASLCGLWRHCGEEEREEIELSCQKVLLLNLLGCYNRSQMIYLESFIFMIKFIQHASVINFAISMHFF